MRTKKQFLPLLILLFLSCSIFGQKRITQEEYIRKYRDVAIKKMKDHGIPASITLAQGLFESAAGNSRLARKANNHFAIKCHKGWKGDRIYQDDDAKGECFRKYPNAAQSFEDHSHFLTTRGRYEFLFKYKPTDYKKWAHGLKKAGYATNPRYAYKLIEIIERYKLYQYDSGKYKPVKVEIEEEIETPATFTSAKAGLYPDPSQFRLTENKRSDRPMYTNNGRKFIIADKGDSFRKIAEEFKIYSWQVYRYNELTKKAYLKVGQMIYLEKKKRKAKIKTHQVNKGEDLYSISQYYGLQLKRLCKMNDLDKEAYLQPGQVLKLR